jgi:hypothetical protein
MVCFLYMKYPRTRRISAFVILESESICNRVAFSIASREIQESRRRENISSTAKDKRTQANRCTRRDTAVAGRSGSSPFAPGNSEKGKRQNIFGSSHCVQDSRYTAAKRPSSPNSRNGRNLAFLPAQTRTLSQLRRQPHPFPLFEVQSNVLPAGTASALGFCSHWRHHS